MQRTEVRPDITHRLVHFTSGIDAYEAFGRLCEIVDERRLLGGAEKVRGGYKCVCFTEAPLPSLPQGLVNPSAYSRYRPFGIIVDKGWLFSQGGRPVIYQSSDEFELLSEATKWRHVRYEPNSDPPVDFTWEREWRIQAEELSVDPSVAGIIVPDNAWARCLIDAHDEQQDFLIREYSLIMDQSIADQYRETFQWPIYVLE